MSLKNVFEEMTRTGVRFQLDGADLRVHSPRGALTDGLRSAIKEHKPELIALCDGRSDPLIPLAAFHERLMGAYSNPNFNIVFGLKLNGTLDVERLKDAFHSVARKNDALRMTFPRLREHLFARVQEEPSISFEVIERPETAEVARAAELEEMGSAARSAAVIDFERGPLFVMKLFRYGAAEHYLFVITTHATLDAVSLEIIFNDVSAFYRGEDPPTRNQYSDAIIVEQHAFMAPVPEARLASWREAYSGAPTPLRLAHTPSTASPKEVRLGTLMQFDVEPAQIAELSTIAAREHVTLGTMLLASFEIAVARLTQTLDIVHGVTSLYRNADTQDTIGSFAKGTPARFDLRRAVTVRDALAVVNSEVFRILDNDVPQLTKFLFDARFPPSLVNFNYLSLAARKHQIDLPGVTCSSVHWFRMGRHGHPMHRDLAVFMVNTGDGGARVFCSYDKAIHDEAFMQRLIQSFEKLVHDGIRRPRDRLSGAD